jgi:C4-dicarboxylate transporter, DctM subunit
VEVAFGLLLFCALLAAGMPIFLVLGVGAAVLFVMSGEPLVSLAQKLADEPNSSTLMALPFFVMAAAFMRRGGIARALVDLATAWVGPLPGSLGLVTVVSCTLFAAICGSSVATALAMGTILLPAMLERGYPRSFALGVIGASGTIGIVIPPSLSLILYGIVTEQSVPRLFLAGILPGILQALLFGLWVVFYARWHRLPRERAYPLGELLLATVRAGPALAIPTIVIAGIYGGMVTVTEAAALSAMIALLVSLVFYRGFTIRETPAVIAEAMYSASTIMIIVVTALAFGHWMTRSGAPAALVRFVLDHHLSTWQFLLTINVLLLIIGCFLEVSSTLLVVMPILAPALLPLGVDPVHFAIIFTHNMEVGLVHPPVGLNLFVLASLCDAPTREVIRGILPFLLLLLVVLAIITYVPELSLWLPNLVYGSS